ncbi:MAG: sigma-70 family RNA polymerase sigma factor [Verrucomicrobiales bacterium]|jgi:RNA polymerase sigma factor (sigma-70 family)|nr:sigma-70 family RNA polymerase sigma factor [Verrucomicrobiales bacterium]
MKKSSSENKISAVAYRQRVKYEARLVKLANAGQDEALAELEILTRPVRRQNAEHFLKGLPFLWDDAMQHGWFGVLRALEKYNPEEKVTFTDYCVWQVKNFIRDFAHKHQKTVRRPSWVFRTRNELKRRTENGESFGAVISALRLNTVGGMEVLKVYNGEVSLDSPSIQGDATSPPLIDTIVDENVPNEERDNRLAQVAAVFDRLDPETRQILTLHYGLSGDEPQPVLRIARALRKSPGEITGIIEQAREHLMQTLTLLRNCDDDALAASMLYLPWR